MEVREERFLVSTGLSRKSRRLPHEKRGDTAGLGVVSREKIQERGYKNGGNAEHTQDGRRKKG